MNPVDDDRDHLRRLIGVMSATNLRELRDAYVADRDHGADAEFCNGRIVAIERELRRREEDGNNGS